MKSFLTLLLIILCLSSFSQEYIIKGSVLDSSTQAPLYTANVIAYFEADSAISAVNTNKQGLFELKLEKPGNYSFLISFVGYKTYQKSISIKNSTLDLGEILLVESPTQLEDITIEAESEEMVIKQDTIEYAASAYSTQEGDKLEELVKKLPGVEYENGQLKIAGKPVKRIIVDGKPFFGDSPQFALKNIPSDMIKKLQVIDEKSEDSRFTGQDDGKRETVLNVVSKPEKKRGYFGSINATLSPPDRYTINSNVNYLKGDRRFSVNGSTDNLGSGSQVISLGNGDIQGIRIPNRSGGGISENRSIGGYYYSNYEKKLETTIRFGYRENQVFQEKDISREFIQEVDQGRIYNEQSESNNESQSYNGSVRLDYKPSEENNFFLSIRGSSSTSLNTSQLSGATLLAESTLNSTRNRNYSQSTSENYNASGSWRHKFNKPGRTLSISIQASAAQVNGQDSVSSENLFFSGDISDQIFDQIGTPSNKRNTLKSTLSLTEKISEDLFLRMSYNRERSSNMNERLLLDRDEDTGEYSNLDPIRSSQFTLKNIKNSFSAQTSVKLKKFSINPQITYQNVIIQNDQTLPLITNTDNRFSALVPRIIVFSRNEENSNGQSYLIVQRGMRVPSASQLQDVIDNTNPLFITQGNPSLRASFNNSLSLNINSYNQDKKSSLNASISASLTENAITNNTIVGDGSNAPEGIILPIGARYSQPINIEGNKSIYGQISYNKRILKEKLRWGISNSINYSINPQLLNNDLIETRSFSYGMGMSLTSDFSEKLEVRIGGRPSLSFVNGSTLGGNQRFFNFSLTSRAKWLFAEGFYISSDVNYQSNGGVSNLQSINQVIWNARFGKRILKKKLNLSIQALDLLKQGAGINRNVSNEFIENNQTNALIQVWRFSLSYEFNKMGGGK